MQWLMGLGESLGTSLAVQWLGLRTLTAEGPGSIPGWGTKILQAVWHYQKKKKKDESLNENWDFRTDFM